jgi:RNA polymerase sigma factor (sigma-70 family)
MCTALTLDQRTTEPSENLFSPPIGRIFLENSKMRVKTERERTLALPKMHAGETQGFFSWLKRRRPQRKSNHHKHATMERREILSLLAQRMAHMPDVQKKVLAMYYYENMPLSDIAACLGLTESKIRGIHRHALASLKAFCTPRASSKIVRFRSENRFAAAVLVVIARKGRKKVPDAPPFLAKCLRIRRKRR